MYFILLLPNIVFANMLYDNTAQTSTEAPPGLTDPCLVQTTEHFSIKDGNFVDGKLTLQSSRLIKEIVTHLIYLIDIERPIYYSDAQKQWITYISFKNSFDYTPLTINGNNFIAANVATVSGGPSNTFCCCGIRFRHN